MPIKSGSEHPKWKGGLARYWTIHRALRKEHPPPKRCQECGLVKNRLELANITGIYDMNFNNYRYMCHLCHNQRDKSKDMSDRICYFCESTRTKMQRQKMGLRPQWFHIDGKDACNICYSRYYNPIYYENKKR